MRKIVAVILICTLAFWLAACANGGSQTTVGETTDNGVAATTTEASTTSEASTKNIEYPFEFNSTDDGFNPITDEDSMTFAEMREEFGAVPKPDGSIYLAGNLKALENEFWRNCTNGWEDWAAYCQSIGVDITIAAQSPTSEEDDEDQILIMNNQISAGADAIMLAPISDSNCLSAVDDAHSAGIPVFSINNEFQGCDGFIGPNSYETGVMAAEHLVSLVGDKEVNVCMVIGMPESGVCIFRAAGFTDTIAKYPNIHMIASQNADWDRQTAKDLAQTWIEQYDDIDAFYCLNDNMALGVVEAVKESSEYVIGENMYILSVDGISEAYDAVRAGDLTSTIAFPPYYLAQMGAEVTVRKLMGQDLPRVIYTPQVVITADNVDSDEAGLVNWTDTQFE